METKPQDNPAEFDLPKLEERVLEFWKSKKTFETSLRKRKTSNRKRTFVFYEGPPYANGKPGIHHVLARVVKDIILRYKSMSGFYVPRRAGWDTHGLPVEIAAEKALGLKSKKDIEQVGIETFNEKAREAVWLYKSEWESLTERIGYWLDLKNAYVTYANDYIESIWYTLKRMWERKLLYKGHKVVPWCVRCGTALSSHELAQGYTETTDQSVYVKFKLKPGQRMKNLRVGESVYVLSWTTTPWTLPGNVALAVGPDIDYVGFEATSSSVPEIRRGDIFLLANSPEILQRVFGTSVMFGPRGAVVNFFGKGEVALEKLGLWQGSELKGVEYEPLFDIPSLRNEASCKIYMADFVTTTDGTGVVHTAVMYGEDDYKLGVKIGLPQHHIVDEEGRFTAEAPAALRGLPVKSKDPSEAKVTEGNIFELLRAGGYFLHADPYTHEYPFCWRCDTPVIYYARSSWFIAMSKLKKDLLAANKTINWIPEYVKEGRFGEWLREVKDWNLSRERYWGTPLPIWECGHCKAVEVIGGFGELQAKTLPTNTFFFVRHGESAHNVDGICGPAKDTPEYTSRLTSKGIKAVQETARLLAKEKIDLIAASPLARAKQTAEILSQETGAQIKIYEDLKDINPGIFEGRPVKEHHAHFQNQTEMFFKEPPEGESRNQAKRRLWQCFKQINSEFRNKRVVIVSHGDPLWLLKAALEGLDIPATLKTPYPKPGKIYQINWKSLPLDKEGNVDAHRPYIDAVALRCGRCGKESRRIPEVADVWYDSGAMPFAQSHFPFDCAQGKGEKLKVKSVEKCIDYPADFISEGMDQTRGWFYTLLAIAAACGYKAPYRNVISLGLVNDKNGQKMSKSRGNIVNPWEVINKHGVDAVRWYFYTLNPPGEPKNFDENEIAKVFRRFHLIIWNSVKFWETYKTKSKVKSRKSKVNVLDEWILARLAETVRDTTDKLETYDIREAAFALEKFVDDLSRWYIRRSRRRFQKALDKADHSAASKTLEHVLRELGKLLAPFTPFFAEVLTERVGGSQSVHLENWPKATKNLKLKTQNLVAEMAEVRRLAAAALALRASLKIKVRQPLRSLKIKVPKGKIRKELVDILAEEVNVKEIIPDRKLKTELELDTVITPALREEGMVREMVRMVQDLRQEAKLKPKDKIILFVEMPDEVRAALMRNEKAFAGEVGASKIEYRKSDKFTAEIYSKFEAADIWIGLRKI